jgi:S1-C subfamily serine protease
MRSAAALILPILMAVSAPTARAEELSKAVRTNLLGGVVYILAYDDVGGKLKPTSTGSGTVITKDGWIVTNFHVAFDYDTGKPHDKLAIGFTKSAKEAPELTCLADPDSGLYDRALDIAVIKCAYDMNGKPLPEKTTFNPIPMGDSETVDIGDEIYVIGYPGVGGETINFTSGKVSGFIGEDSKTAGDRWIKTEADLAPGNSGGACVNKKGELIGIPTMIHFAKASSSSGFVPKINLIRPMKYAKEFIDGSLSMQSITKTVPVKIPSEKIPSLGGSTPAKATPGVTVTGRLLSSDSGKPVQDAVVIFFKPGVTISQARKAKNLESLLYTTAKTNSSGTFKSDLPLQMGKSYSVVIDAAGFQPIEVDDGVEIGTEDAKAFDVGSIELKKKK